MSIEINIWYKTGEMAWLSNLAYRPFTVADKRYMSVEHAYQTWKSGEFDRIVYNKPWREGAKFAGKKGTRTENDWNISLMKAFILESFLDGMNEWPKAMFLKLVNHHDVEFTHRQDTGIWRTKFPECLHEVARYLTDCPQFAIPHVAEKLLTGEMYEESN